jgi:hypothetical protein
MRSSLLSIRLGVGGDPAGLQAPRRKNIQTVHPPCSL